MRRAKVVYWNNIPSPYMVARFNALADTAPFDFEVWFNERTHANRSWAVDESCWRFKYRYLKRFHLGRFAVRIPPILHVTRPDLLIMLYDEPVFVTGWLIAWLRRSKTLLWCEITIGSWLKRAAWKNAIKHVVFRLSAGTLSAGSQGREYAMRFGTAGGNARILRHVIDADRFRTGAWLGVHKRNVLREALGVGGVVFTYVGHLWERKGMSDLLQAYSSLKEAHEFPMSLLLIGDGPDEATLRAAVADHGIRDVIFAGFRQSTELPELLGASDVFVFPTLGDAYGLVVDEAMAAGLPVICTSAAGEIGERIEDGVSGFIVAPSDAAGLASRMRRLGMDEALRKRLGENARRAMYDSTPERWAEDLVRVSGEMLGNVIA